MNVSEHDCTDIHAAPRLSHSVAPVTSARPLTSRRARRRRMRAPAHDSEPERMRGARSTTIAIVAAREAA
ncbi:putative 4-hydroxy-3-methylbut-2-en-1-yl diphosphate synthase [Burkholderia thailandensis]|uniref:4-hydroxy-3-methylbut-2-en-1-yl diphosphate synthase n=1 Tax=Burkholderia thailandensis TaxID=57975 RepID=A0AAW9CW29_BURTH|nr:putative 4-hydroxy-3-methylbut-2-en-1-yl diphosphate synthase [Burkholderia thailandensis]MDW9254662.1 putative 4-hydroxy-3-methylbut-2-en-1-yl diphosphate synthase [Burkholderia thailandensis]